MWYSGVRKYHPSYYCYFYGKNLVKNIKNLENIVISIPDDKTQDKLVAFFDYLDEMIEVHKKKLLSMKQQQKSLQQLLLTGIVRVD